MTELAVYETFEDMFGRKTTLEELTADISLFSQQSVLWVCASIITGVQLWDRIDSQPEAYAQFLTSFFDGDTRLRIVADKPGTNPGTDGTFPSFLKTRQQKGG